MTIKKLVVEFVTVFAIALVVTAIVTVLGNSIGHGASAVGAVDWDTSFPFAIIFGIILTWVKSREIKEKSSSQKLKQQKEGKIKRIFTFTISLMVLTACTALQLQATTEPAATDMPQVSMPNPASVYCEQKGNKLEIHTATDGSQSGICVFPDGSTCDEWVYYRGECGPAAQESLTPAMTVEEQASGGYMQAGTSEEIADWWGVIKSTESGAQYDDYFERQGLGQIIYFGIDSMDPAVKSQIETVRDSGKVVHLYGTLLTNVPDYNGSQILVDRIEVEE